MFDPTSRDICKQIIYRYIIFIFINPQRDSLLPIVLFYYFFFLLFLCKQTNTTTKLTPARTRDYNNSVAVDRRSVAVAADDRAERWTRRFAHRYPDDECAAVTPAARWTPAVPEPSPNAGAACIPVPFPGPPSPPVPTQSWSRSREIARDRAAPAPSANAAVDGDAAEGADDNGGCDRSRRRHRLRRPPSYCHSRRRHRYRCLIVDPPHLENDKVVCFSGGSSGKRHAIERSRCAEASLIEDTVSFKLKWITRSIWTRSP